MERQAVANIRSGDIVDSIFAIREMSLNATYKGQHYLRISLSDATGTITGHLWDEARQTHDFLRDINVIRVLGVGQLYQDKLQVKITEIYPEKERNVKPDWFIPSAPNLGQMRQELLQLIERITDSDYQRLLKAIFVNDTEFFERFCLSPAAKEVHHACIGGLLWHSMTVAKLAEAFTAASTANLDRDLLVTGSLLHDVGKVEELQVNCVISYTDIGNLLGHLVIGAMLLERYAASLGNFPRGKLLILQHLLLSHHGEREYGSAVLPATAEAMALCQLDNLDAKTEAATRLIDVNVNGKGNWTERHWMFDTKLFRGFMDSPEAQQAVQYPTVKPVDTGKNTRQRNTDVAKTTVKTTEDTRSLFG